MSLWTELRALAWLKRLAIAAERIAASQETLARAAAASLAPRPAPRLTEFESLDLAAANRDWAERQRLEAEERGEDYDNSDARQDQLRSWGKETDR